MDLPSNVHVHGSKLAFYFFSENRILRFLGYCTQSRVPFLLVFVVIDLAKFMLQILREYAEPSLEEPKV